MGDASEALDRLIEIVRTLRGPEGCRWDRKQTAASLRPYMLEEAYEVADAIDREDWEALGSELGDLLLHILMTSEICMDEGLFSIEDVAEGISDKLVRRHPHVFDSPGNLTPEEVEKQWEAIKASEKAEEGFFSSIPASMPSLQTSWRIQQRASEIGFEWTRPEGAREKMMEELGELAISMDEGDRQSQEEELGDLLFSLVNYCRMTGFEPESVLRKANSKFMNRFREMELLLREKDETLMSASLEQMMSAWRNTNRNTPGDIESGRPG
jgi:tetrapyrrole methylase family protein/MazG family protein